MHSTSHVEGMRVLDNAEKNESSKIRVTRESVLKAKRTLNTRIVDIRSNYYTEGYCREHRLFLPLGLRSRLCWR